jgi:choline-sulfatase
VLLALVGAAGAFGTWEWLLAHRLADSPGPVILISIDTLRADHLPVYGYRALSTPAIDALASDGVVFEHAYSHSPQTLPAHTSILSGRLPFEHGVRDNVGFTVKPDLPLLPTMLRARGYLTAGFASAFVLRPDTGISRGFDVYDDATASASADAPLGTIRRDGSATLDLAVRWLDAAPRGKPFFLFVHFYEPHRPYRPPARHAGYANPYDGTIAYADELVGRLVSDLKRLDVYERATIVLLSDHGEGLGDHGEQEHGIFLYDETIRVPLVVKLPRERDAGRRVTAPVQHVDIVPTVLDLAGARPPKGLPGRSLVAAMDGRARPEAQPRGVYSEALYPLYHFGWSPLFALTDERYRYVLAPRPELYDLAADRAERTNIEQSKSAVASAMRGALDGIVAGRGVQAPATVTATDLERFQSLGYIGSASNMPAAAGSGRLIDPKDEIGVLERYREGVELRGDGRLAEAAAAFRQVVRDVPTMVDVWSQLGQTLARMGDIPGASDALSRAVALRPDSAENLAALAAAEVQLGLLDLAAAHARAALAGEPALGHETLARVALARGRQDEALAEAQLAQQADPDLPLPLFIEGVALHGQRRYQEALALFRRAASGLDRRRLAIEDLHYYAGDSLAQMNDYAGAEAEFRKELSAYPGSKRARVGLALVHASEGRADEAETELRSMLGPSAPPASYALVARTLAVVGNRGAASDVLATGLRRFPADPELRALREQAR